MKEMIRDATSRRLFPAVLTGLLIGTTSVFYHISLATLIFSGSLSEFLASGIGLVLFGGAVLGLTAALLSSLPGIIASVQDSPAAIFALVAAAIAVRVSGAGSAQQVYLTVVATLSLASLITGVVFFAMGRLGLSSFIRFVPYPVVGGFLAGTGWLLAAGALRVMTGLPLALSDLPTLIGPALLPHWLPGVAFAFLMLFLSRRYKHPLLMPILLATGLALFYAVLALTGTSMAEASAEGYLLGPFPNRVLWMPLSPALLPSVDWSAVIAQAGKLVSILVLSTIGLLLNASALELAVQKDIDLDRELSVAGIGNVLGALGGSPVGFQTIGTSALSQRMGGGSRLTTLVTALLLGGALIFGASILSFFPKVLLGGLLLSLGLSFLYDWVVASARSLPASDYVLVLLILAIIATVGFLEGVAAGTVIAVLIFVINYSRVEFVKDELTGLTYRSRMERPVEHRRLLEEKGPHILVLRLQGFLFFGTAQSLLNRIRVRLGDADQPAVRFLLLDFHRVSALDSSAVIGFTRLHQLAQAGEIKLVLAELTPTMRERLERGGLIETEGSLLRMFPSLDHAMEWCEGKMLAEDQRSIIRRAASLESRLQEVFQQPGQIERFRSYLEKLDLPAGAQLIHQGDSPDAMYFVDSGRVSAQLELEPGRAIRLSSMGAGTVVGEVGLYLHQERTASVITDMPSVVFRLPATALTQMRERDPDLAAALHEWMVRLLAHRLTDNNRTLEALLS